MGSSASQSATVTSRMSSSLSKGMMAAGAAAAAAAKGVMIAGKAVADVGKYSVQVGKDFESATSDAAATANASAEDFAKMERAAMEMGETISKNTKTATESAQALKYMALAGWDVDTSVSALPSVLKMSEASGMELERTSDLVTDSMAALGVTVDELPGYLDVATKAQNKSNQSAEQLMEAYLGVGGTMKNLNVPITESATALGVLANRGIKGSEAGTALNAIMVNLTTGTGQAGQMMQKLGVSAFDSQGRFVGLEETLQQLNGALKGCSEEERNAALAAIGGKQHIDALNNLMAGLNTTNEEGVTEWAALTGELENCKGSLDAMRDTKLDNLEGDLAALESATQDAGIKIYEHLNAPLRDSAQFGAQAIRKASAAMEKDGFSGMAGAAGGAIADGLGMIIERLPEFLATAVSSIVSFVVGFATNLPASISIGVAKGIPRLLKAFRRLGVDLMKAVIKGILSLGSAPLKALKSLFFGGGRDKDAQKAGTDAAKDYKKGAGDAAGVAADASLALPMTPSGKEAMAAATLPGGQEGAPPVEGPANQATDASNFAMVAPAMTEAGSMDVEGIRVEAEQANAGIALDVAQPATIVEPSTMAETAIAARSDAGFPAEASLESETMPPAGVSEDALPVPSGALRGASADAIQEAAEAATMNEPGVIEAATKMPVEAIQATSETLEIPTEAIQMTAETSGVPAGAIQTAAETSNALAPSVQAMEGVEVAPEEALREAAGATADAGRAGDALGAAEPPGIGMGALRESEAANGQSPLDGLTAVPVAPFSGEVPQEMTRPPVTGADLVETAKSVTPGAAASQTGAFGSPWRLKGICEAIRESFGVLSPDGAARPAQVILPKATSLAPSGAVQEAVTVIGAESAGNATANAGARAAQPEEPPKMDFAWFLPMARDFVKALARRLNPISTPAKTAQRVIDVRRLLDGEAGVAARGLSPVGVDFGAIRDFMDKMEMDASRTKPREDALQSNPEARPFAKGSKIADALNGLLGGRVDPRPNAPSASPSFTYSPTFNIEGSGDVKSDVEKANRWGMREFEKLMEQYVRKNKRTLFI